MTYASEALDLFMYVSFAALLFVYGALVALAGWAFIDGYRERRYRRYLARQPKPREYPYRSMP